MARFQVRKDGTGFLIIPRSVYKSKNWKQKTEVAITEGVDGSLILREVRK
jgi:hypothetical protein